MSPLFISEFMFGKCPKRVIRNSFDASVWHAYHSRVHRVREHLLTYYLPRLRKKRVPSRFFFSTAVECFCMRL